MDSPNMEARQGLALGLGRATGAAAFVLSGQLEVPALLMDPLVMADQEGTIDRFTVGGQSVMCSDKGVGWRVFHAQAQMEGARAMGLPMAEKTVVSIEGTLAAAGTVLASLGVDPIPESEGRVPNDPEISRRLNYVFGLGSVSVPAGGTVEMVATARRHCVLGPMVLYSGTPAAALDVTIENVEVNNAPLPAGRLAGATIDRIPLVHFDYLRTDLDGRVLHWEIRHNHQISILLRNYNASPITVYGGILVLPD